MSDPYKGPERRAKLNGNGVTWKWISGGLMTVSALLTAAWLNANTGEITALKMAQKQTDKEASDLKGKAGVIEEKVRRIEQDVNDVKESQKEQGKKMDETNRKLDELLRRSR